MIREAIEKVRKEMEESNDQAVEVIGEYLLGVIEENNEAAEKIMAPGKSILGSLNEMSNIARKKAKNGRKFSVIGENEGLKIVSDYYGMSQETEVKKVQCEKSKVINLNEHHKSKQHGALELNLDDLL